MPKKKPNIVLFGIDSLVSTHMSCYGYPKQTTPHIDRFAQGGVLFEQTFSTNIPTTPGYSCMLTGQDIFNTQCVALRHGGPLTDKVTTLPEILRGEGYATTMIGFSDNPASRGFERYLDYKAWGDRSDGCLPKAQSLNAVAVPELERLAAGAQPFFLMLRHMDPHSPYLPPEPYDRMFYYGHEGDPKNPSMQPVKDFRPFWWYFQSWMPEGITDKDYIIAQYDGALAYMDACLQRLFTQLETLGILDDTIVVINSDHGETLYDHECWFDHHGLYDCTLKVPTIIRYPKKLPMGKRVKGYNSLKDLTPTLLELAEIKTSLSFDGRSLMALANGETPSFASNQYITECTWMRKHGWRTPQWKLIVALEPDFHFKPEVELYDLSADPAENLNLAQARPAVVAHLRQEMEAHIARRKQETGNENPIFQQPNWHGLADRGITRFQSSQQAYDSLQIGSPKKAQELQAKAAAGGKE